MRKPMTLPEALEEIEDIHERADKFFLDNRDLRIAVSDANKVIEGLERNLRDYKTACEEWKKICDVQLHKISTLESEVKRKDASIETLRETIFANEEAIYGAGRDLEWYADTKLYGAGVDHSWKARLAIQKLKAHNG